MRGAGKTTLSRIAAKAFSYGFVDVDHEIEERLKARSDGCTTIKQLVERDGWDVFRKLELEVFEEVMEKFKLNTIIR